MMSQGRLAPTLLAPVLLVLIAAALAATIMLELRGRSRDSEAMSPVPVEVPPIQSSGRLAAPDPDQLARLVATVLARPLFSPARRPPAAPEAAPDAPAPGLPRIAGIVVTPAGRRAIFAAKGSKPLVVGEGGQVGNFTVQSIRAGQVTLRGPAGERVLSPVFDPDAPVPATSPVPGAAPFGLPPGAAPPGAPPQGGLAVPGLPGFRLQPQPPGLGGIPGLAAPAPPGPAPRTSQ